MNKPLVTYHIIGGGVSGLASAKFLKQKHPASRVTIYEAASHPGGRACSFYDSKLERNIDNATHVILGANGNVRSLLGDIRFSGLPYFWQNQKSSRNFFPHFKHILLSIFNTKAQDIPLNMLKKLFYKLFPFLPVQLKVYFSKGNLSERLIAPLAGFADSLKTGYCLKNFEAENNRITALIFNRERIEIPPQDKIISALDAANYAKIFDGEEFVFNEITNIFFRTSQALHLPGNVDFLATPELTADWIFINGDITAVTISDSKPIELDDDTLARKIWLEIRGINGLHPAFLPAYHVLRHKRATIRQDTLNNSKRPKSAKSKYANLRLAGDWTMRDYPASLEAAVLSAKRAIKF